MSKRIGLLSVAIGLCAVVTGYATDRDPRFGSPLYTFPKDSCYSLILLTESPSIFQEEAVDGVNDDDNPEIQEQIEPSSVFASVCTPPFVAIEQTAAEKLAADEEQGPLNQVGNHEQIELSILFTPASEPPCELNADAVAIASEVDEQESRQMLDELYQQLADVVRNYPHTKAAKEAEEMLKSAGLQIWGERLIPANCIIMTVPILR